MSEEVGSRCSILGSHILTLQSGVAGSRHGKLKIYSPTDTSEPVIIWDHDKIRRTGKLGQLLFIEIGRRCHGGPGLLWMYTGNCNKKAYEMRDVLRRCVYLCACVCLEFPIETLLLGNSLYSNVDTQ